MLPKAKKEASAPPKVKAKAKAVKTGKAVPKGIHSHTLTQIHKSPTFPQSKALWLQRPPKYPGRAPRRNKLDH